MAHEFIEHLKEDHQKLRSIGKQMLEAEGAREREDLLEQLRTEFEPHAAGEEASIYKYMTSEEGEMREMGMKATQEHQLARSLTKDLMKVNAENDTFKAKAAVLVDANDHHIEEEENKVFPLLERQLGKDKFDELYEEYQAAEEEAEDKV